MVGTDVVLFRTSAKIEGGPADLKPSGELIRRPKTR